MHPTLPCSHCQRLQLELVAIDRLVERWRQWEMAALESGAIFEPQGKIDRERLISDTLLGVSQRLQVLSRVQRDQGLAMLNEVEITYAPTSSTPAPRRSLRTSVATFLDFTFRTRARKAFWLPLAWSVFVALLLLLYRAVKK
jgi:hypothetical protein